MNWKIIVLLAVTPVFSFPLRAQTPDPAAAAEARLREALRNSMLQLRSAQQETATAQSKLTEIENEKTALKNQFDALNAKMDELVTKSAVEKDAAEKMAAALQTQVSAKDTEIARLNEALAKWKEGYQLAVNFAEAKENERAKGARELILLQRKVEDRERKNLELFKVGNEILTRYQKYSIGDALAAKEPFTGIARARLQELVQDYRDKLVDQKIKSGEGAPQIAGAPAKP